MSKYIDAEKLIAKIAVLRKELPDTIEHLNDEESGFARGQQYELTAIEAEILSLQQEQPETLNNLVDIDAVREDFIAEVYRVLGADPTNDRANAIIDAFDSLPTIQQEQPEADGDDGKFVKISVRKEFAEQFQKLGDEIRAGQSSFIGAMNQQEVDLDFQIFAKEMDSVFALPSSETENTEEEPLNWEYAIARHFYELGRNARK